LVNIGQERRDNPSLCKASYYAKKNAEDVVIRLFPVELLCIVSDDGF
jgi:hypothetical protein